MQQMPINQQPEAMMEGDMQGAQPMPEINGEELQMLLFSRVQQLSPPEMQILDDIITPQTVPVLFKLFPELGVLFERGTHIQAFLAQQGAGGPEGAQGMPQQPMPQQPAPAQAANANPLVDDRASAGLMGMY